jgi:16S rRNA (adenine1518-N6/adenine1519-N6)-dimethyltransferase
MNRLNPVELRQRLQAAGAYSKKSFGQHFLIDGEVLEAIVKAAEIEPGEAVIEIGPGLGVLTECLVEVGASVTAFEADTAMQRVMAEDFPAVTVVPGDAIHTIPDFLPAGSYKVVANIPYQITTPLLRLFLEGGVRPPVSLTLLIQREVAERLAAPARTGERGYLSVLTQYYAQVELVRVVPPSAFWPMPAVQSAVIRLRVRPQRLLEPADERPFFKYVKAGFLEPRKQLKNVLAGMRGVEPAEMANWLTGEGMAENVRAQELSLEQWISLYKADV